MKENARCFVAKSSFNTSMASPQTGTIMRHFLSMCQTCDAFKFSIFRPADNNPSRRHKRLNKCPCGIVATHQCRPHSDKEGGADHTVNPAHVAFDVLFDPLAGF